MTGTTPSIENALPARWDRRKFKYLSRETGERNGVRDDRPMLSVSGYRGVELREYESDHLKRTAEELETYLVVKPGELVLNTMWLNHCGLGVAKDAGIVSPAYRVYRIDRSTLDLSFCHHLLRSEAYVQEYTRLAYGIRPNSLQVSAEDFGLLPIPIPSLSEQRGIAVFLDGKTAAIDALIIRKERLIGLLGEKRQALITRAVTKGLNPNVPMKDSGIEWLGRVPAHWRFVPTRFAAKMIQTGTTPPSDEPQYFEEANVPWYGPAAFGPALEVATPTRFVNHLAVSHRKVRPLPPGTVVVVTIGATVGRVAMLNTMGTTNQQITGIVFDPRIVFDRFAAFQFKRLETVLRGSASTTTLPILNQSAVGSMPVLVPPLPEQEAIVRELDEALRQIDGVAAKQRESIDSLREYRQALISAAVTGRIEIPAEEAA